MPRLHFKCLSLTGVEGRSLIKRGGIFVLFVTLAVVVVWPVVSWAQGLDPGFAEIDAGSGLVASNPKILIARIIRFLLGFLGILAVGIVLYGGFLWMTAAGNSDRVDLAKKVLQNGAIGLIIILISFSIVSFILSRFMGAIEGGPSGGGGGPEPCINCIALGGGIIEDHYPERNAVDVPRNTSVIITFKEPILVDPDSLEDGSRFMLNAVANGESFEGVTCGALWCGELNTDVFELKWDNDNNASTNPESYTGQFNVYTNDEKTFVIQPQDLLGDPAFNSQHTATVKSSLTKKDGNVAMLTDYVWIFEVSTIIDTTPPRIVDIFPYEGDESPRSGLIMIEFDEPINPISATGLYSSGDSSANFNNIETKEGATVVSGRYEIGNGYKTVQFTTVDLCATNSCNQSVYCLPKNSTINVTVKAATLWATEDEESACYGQTLPANNPSVSCYLDGFDGVMDVANNSLDGQRNEVDGELELPTGDGTADGPDTDTFDWSFETNDTIITTGPIIREVTPAPDASKVDPTIPLGAIFNRKMSLVKSYTDDLGERRDPARIYEQVDPLKDPSDFSDFTGGFVIRQSAIKKCSLSGTVCALNNDCDGGALDLCGRENVIIKHTGLTKPVDIPEKTYEPRLSSTIKDAYQACFYKPIGATPNPLYPKADRDTPDSWKDFPDKPIAPF